MAVQTTRTVEELGAYCARLRAAGLDCSVVQARTAHPAQADGDSGTPLAVARHRAAPVREQRVPEPASGRGAPGSPAAQPGRPGANRRAQPGTGDPVPAARRGRAGSSPLADRDQVHAPRRGRLHDRRRPEVRHEVGRSGVDAGHGVARPRQRGWRARLLDGHPRLADRQVPREPDVRALSRRAAAGLRSPGRDIYFPWAEAYAALLKRAEHAPDPFDDVLLEYVDPATGSSLRLTDVASPHIAQLVSR